MDLPQFKRLLFRSSVAMMACDGEIHEYEIMEMDVIAEKTSYFQGMDHKIELQDVLEEIKNGARSFIQSVLNEIQNEDLSVMQDLLILEVLMRIIGADQRLDENEIKFINLVRSKLNVADDFISERFGNIDYLDIKRQNRVDGNMINDFNYDFQLDVENIERLEK